MPITLLAEWRMGLIVETQNIPALKKNAANLSVASNLFLTLLKIAIGILTSSISVVSEAAHSGFDLVAALIARYAVVEAHKPPDKEHHFGHGKVENLGSLIEAILIFVISVIIVYSSVKKIIYGTQIEHVDWGILVMFVSSIINAFVAVKVKKVSKLTDSPALEADALHILTDVYCTAVIFAGLGAIYIGEKFGADLRILDPVMAIMVAVYISFIAVGLVRKAMNILADIKLSDEDEKVVISSVEKFKPEYINFHSLRTRKAGSMKHIDLHIVVARNKHVGKAHELCDRIEKEIKTNMPQSDVVIHIEPCNEDCKGCEHLGEECSKA